MRLAVLMIAGSDNKEQDGFYSDMELILTRYYIVEQSNKKFGNLFDFYFLYCDPNLKEEYVIQNNRFIVRGNEARNEGIKLKTYKALEVLRDKYDFFVRTTVNTIVNLKKVFELIDSKLFNGYAGACERCGTIRFVGGYFMVFNKTTVNLLLESWKEYCDKFPEEFDDMIVHMILTTHNGIMGIELPATRLHHGYEGYNMNMFCVKNALHKDATIPLHVEKHLEITRYFNQHN